MNVLTQALRPTVHVACAALLAALCSAASSAPPTWLPSDNLPYGTALLQVEDLKEMYLECDRLSSVSFLDSSTAAICSVASEELRRIGFDGRADEVLAWWRVMVAQRRAMLLNRPIQATGKQSASL